jgi:hypothetical protein
VLQQLDSQGHHLCAWQLLQEGRRWCRCRHDLRLLRLLVLRVLLRQRRRQCRRCGCRGLCRVLPLLPLPLSLLQPLPEQLLYALLLLRGGKLGLLRLLLLQLAQLLLQVRMH